MADPIVIVGAGLAGYGVARELRRLDGEVPILLLSADGAEQYAKPNLSAALAAGKDADGLVQAHAADVAAKLQIEVRAHCRVSAIDVAAQTLTANGEALRYRDLVLAIGADPMRPPFLTDAVRADGRVLQVNDLGQYRVWRDKLAGAQRVVVIGGGLIGVEFAQDLLAANVAVEVVDLASQPLGRLLPREAALVLQAALANAGVRWRLGQGIAALELHADRVDVVLADGQIAQGDLVLVAIGLTPRTELARAAGLRVERAIAVDAYLRTSAAHVYALGDCAAVDGQWLPFVAPILHASKALAATLAGKPTAVRYPPMPVLVKTPACPTVVLPPPPDAIWQTTVDGDGVRALAHDGAGRLRGFALLGAATRERLALTQQVAVV